ncbi:peptidoglycan DD-metalloendopeptidase family protein [bacterium]|nr:peptidoglycan DD-metalloendopeptidase family protein [bacterium]
MDMKAGSLEGIWAHAAWLVSVLILVGCAGGVSSRAPVDYRGVDERPRASPSSAVGGASIGGAIRPPLRQPADDRARRAITVRAGDSLGSISRRYSVNMRALAAENGLSEPYVIKPGDVIYLPRPNVHVVERGESFESVAERFSVDRRSLALLNGLSRPWELRPGDEVLLPPLATDRGRPAGVSSTQRAAAAATSTPGASQGSRPQGGSPPAPQAALVAGKFASNPAQGARFLWPVEGPVLAGYGLSDGGVRNDGVSISAELGAPVRAAAAGEVIYVGTEVTGFGNLLLISHKDGWVTAYAHTSRILVKQGEMVRQGQVVAEVGATGSVRAPQVHFQLRRGREPVDPTGYLPPLADRR